MSETSANENEIETGEQTQITPIILEIANQIPDDEDNLISNISSYVKTLKYVPKGGPILSRTAEEVIQSKENWGCHEVGIVFASILRAKGKNVSYIQTFYLPDLKTYDEINGGKIGGHVFLKMKKDEKDIFIDSTSGIVTLSIPDEYIFGAEGLDSWDIGLREPDDYLKLFKQRKKELNI